MKKGLILIISVVVIVFTVGVTYAFFSYTRTSETESKVITGEIYLIFNEGSDTLTLDNAMPLNDTSGLGQDDYFEFTISGKNTSSKDIAYNVIFFQGADQTGERLSTEFIKINMTKKVGTDGTPETIIDKLTYDDWDNRVVYTSTIPAGTTSVVNHIFNLKMWISNNIWISDTDVGANYTTAQFNSGYQSLKVSVEASAS